ncbi:unnamed protein product [Mytilus coruscus]|uniref:Uncharacterized protein n=1 Tax=Mytilus coruscus TaxID=42192 RepID=A0A6J8AN66_MYTCO|nr:unnamed protein product [Mytilus coruscus]
MGIFNLEKNGCQKLVACLSENSIAVQIWKYHNEEQQICNNNYSTIREYLISTVHLLQRRYKINIHYECFLKCPEGKYYKKAGKVSCDEACDNYFCPEHGSTHSVEEIRKIWFQKEEERCKKKQRFHSALSGHEKRMHIRKSYFLSEALVPEIQNQNSKIFENNFSVAEIYQRMGRLPSTRWIVLERSTGKLLRRKNLSFHMKQLNS